MTERDSISMSSSPSEGHRKRRLITFARVALLLCSAILATAVTHVLHHSLMRFKYHYKLEHQFGTMYLNELIDRPLLTEKTGLDLPEDLEDRPPEFLEFCRRVVEMAKARKHDPASRYDVWTVEHGFAHGWPFVSQDLYARVVLEEVTTSGRFICQQIWVDHDGQTPLVYGGWIGNWIVYFCTTLCVLWFGRAVFVRIKRVLRRYPQGHCQSCGYNLTGNVSGICPECGVAIVEKNRADC